MSCEPTSAGGPGVPEDPTRTIRMSGGTTDSEIGPYRLVRQIGEGGMGVVYQAQQVTPIRRDVALKIIKPGMDSKQVTARFNSERQALAVMDHPNIAQVFDAGTTDERLPYFVMELIDGIAITRYCDSRRLTLRNRIEVFVPVCHAIQHAHQKGVIHRDLKPSNILVTEIEGKPAAKVIDFGLAKALGPQASDATMVTNLGTIVGTLNYMSPEQAELTRRDVDTRSDVYSLGAVLYELLTGTTPLAGELLNKSGYLEALKQIREQESDPPSVRLQRSAALAEVAAQRQTDPARLPKLLRGELDWIAMKALEKDRSRRYESANALARDLERYLAGEPVDAAPQSVAYRAGKFIRKHRTWLAATGAFALLLVAGGIVSAWQAIRATRAEQEARAVNDFLRNDLLAQADAAAQISSSDTKRDADIKVRTLLDRAAASVAGKFSGQPQVEASVRSTIADAYVALGLYAEASRQAGRAAEIRKRTLGSENRDTLASLRTLSRAEYYLGEFRRAEELDRNLVDVQRRRLGAENPETLESMAALAQDYFGQSKVKEAVELDTRVLEIRKRVLGPEDKATLASLSQLANDLTLGSDYNRAEEMERSLLDANRRKFGSDHPETVAALNNLAVIDYYQGKYSDAAGLLAETLDIQRRVHGADHPQTLTAMSNLASVYAALGDFQRAYELHVEVADAYRRTQGPEHVLTGVALSNMGGALIALGRFAEAYPIVQESISIRTRNFGADNLQTLITRDLAGLVRRGEQRYVEAEGIHRQVLETARRAPGPRHATTLTAMYRLANVLGDEHRYAEAEMLEREATEAMRTVLGESHPQTLAATNHLAYILEQEERNADAERLLRGTQTVFEKSQPNQWQRFNCLSLLGSSLAGQGKYPEAEHLLLDGYTAMAERRTTIPALDKSYLVRSGEAIVSLYRAWKQPGKAEEWRRKVAKEAK